MIHLHTLGESLITVGRKEVRPGARLVFAALLYLSVERGRRVPRAALQELLFPESSERSGAHSLRQLLYKLRQLGAPIGADEGSVFIAPESVVDESEEAAHSVESLAAGLLPGYTGLGTEGFTRWLDGIRTAGTVRIVQRLLALLANRRDTGDQAGVRKVSSALLELDPLNEVATLAKAESLALTGSKHEALRVLDTYLAEVGPTAPELRAPAQQLRRRIAERVEAPDPGRPPLIGREEELAWLNAQHRRAASGKPTISIVWGEPGIGKTRLVQEFVAQAQLGKARIVAAQCHPTDMSRPLGAISDMVPQLLQTRGALGVSPRSMEWLKRLESGANSATPQESEPGYVANQLRLALLDLLVCIGAEGPLVLIVEDAHWLDEPSARFLLTVVPERNGAIHVVMTRRPTGGLFDNITLAENTFVHQLAPLSLAASHELLTRSFDCVHTASDPVVQDCLALAQGNPLFLRTIGAHLQLRGAAPTSSGLIDLLTQRVRVLDAPSLLLLRTAAILGAMSTHPRLTACAGQPEGVTVLALQNLADRGLLAVSGGSIRCSHDLLADAVLQDAPRAVRIVLHERAAGILEEEGLATRQARVLWSCAEHWERANQGPRAATVLRRCGVLAMEVGQPELASTVLERAQSLCERHMLPAVLEEAIRIAEAFDHNRVLRDVGRYRELVRVTPGLTVPPSVELAELNSLRRTGIDIWSQRARLRACACSERASLADRIKAARIFIVTSEECFARDEALALENDVGHIWRDSDSFEARELGVWSEMLLGDVSRLPVLGRALMSRLDEVDLPRQPTLLNNLSRMFLASGEVAQAIDTARRAAMVAQQLDGYQDMLLIYARVTDCYMTAGEFENAHDWVQRANELHADEQPAAAYHLSNRIALALADFDWRRAEADLERLRRLPDASKLHGRRSTIGLELLTASCRGDLDPKRLDFNELEAIDALGSCHTEHLFFALGFFVAQVAAGDTPRAEERFRNYGLRRRERYPLRPAVRGFGLSKPVLERVMALCDT